MMLLPCRFTNSLSVSTWNHTFLYIFLNSEQEHVMASFFSWFCACFPMVESKQGVEKSLDQSCVAKMEPSKVGFCILLCFLTYHCWYWDLLFIWFAVYVSSRIHWQHKNTGLSCQRSLWFLAGYHHLSPASVLILLQFMPTVLLITKHIFRFEMSWYQLLLISMRVGQSADSILRNVMPHRWMFCMVDYFLVKNTILGKLLLLLLSEMVSFMNLSLNPQVFAALWWMP